MTRYLSFSITLYFLMCGCRNSDRLADTAAYHAEIEAWHNKRLNNLKAPEGWLNVAGLFWLQEGMNTFGSDTANSIVFPERAPSFIGVIERRGDSVYLRSTAVPVLINGLPAGNRKLKDDSHPDPDILSLDSMAWFILTRGGRYAVRLRDYTLPGITGLTSIPCFETDPAWRIKAKFKPYEKPEMCKVQTVIGTEEEKLIPGELTFKISGRKYHLYPFTSGDQLFIVFGDETNRNETYPAGRFLYANGPDTLNQVIIDFNKAYNPPCAFTPYATCPLPLRRNIISVEIQAGEKSVHLFNPIHN